MDKEIIGGFLTFLEVDGVYRWCVEEGLEESFVAREIKYHFIETGDKLIVFDSDKNTMLYRFLVVPDRSVKKRHPQIEWVQSGFSDGDWLDLFNTGKPAIMVKYKGAKDE